ncbi:MAG: tetratricopeptide repeat protein [Anaerolineae bacterium]
MDSEDIPDWMSEGALDDEDAALAWLNEIAAKYDPDFDASAAAAEPTPEPAATDAGSAETDPMITEPPTMEVDELPDWLKDEPAPAAEDDDMPDWLREPTEAAVSEAEDDLPDWLKGEAPAQPTAPPPVARSEDAMSWLDQQVSKQGVDPSGIVSEELTADEPPQPEMPFIPDPDAVATEAADEELPAWMRDIDEAALEPSVEEEIEIPELDIEEDELASLDAALGLEDTQADDLDAIFGVETTTEPEPAAPPAPEPEPQAPAAPPEPEPAAESVPSWLSGTQEVQPVSDDLEAFLRATEPAAAPEPEPAAPETAQPEPVSEPEPVAAEPAGTFGGPRTTSMLPDLTRAPVPSGQGAEIIQQARQLVKANNYEEALRSYERLISAEQLLPDTISDLRNVLKARPSARARRLLGDALMMQGSLQDALEAYRSALDEL